MAARINRKLGDFLDHPGRIGPFGGLMDEYARAADDFCTVVEEPACPDFRLGTFSAHIHAIEPGL